jgi:hypothetical protein
MHTGCCKKQWAGCPWCRRVLCPECPALESGTLCKTHTQLSLRRYDLEAEVEACNTYLGPNVPLEVNETLWVPHQLIGFGSQHQHACFVQEVWYWPYTDQVCLWIATKYGGHTIAWELKPYYWANLLKQVGIARIPKKKGA